MLEFCQNDKNIGLSPIYNKARERQMVIFDPENGWGIMPDSCLLSQYSVPSIFIVIAKFDHYYVLCDSKGHQIKVVFDTSTSYLYDAQEWLTWKAMHERDTGIKIADTLD